MATPRGVNDSMTQVINILPVMGSFIGKSIINKDKIEGRETFFLGNSCCNWGPDRQATTVSHTLGVAIEEISYPRNQPTMRIKLINIDITTE